VNKGQAEGEGEEEKRKRKEMEENVTSQQKSGHIWVLQRNWKSKNFGSTIQPSLLSVSCLEISSLRCMHL
jgi:hypothetical protein